MKTTVRSNDYRSKTLTASEVDVDSLEAELSARLSGEVRFDAGSRAMYSVGSGNYRQVPLGVVVPRDLEDIVASVEVCRRHGAPIVGRGGGTSIPGQIVNVAVVLDTTKYLYRVLDVDREARRARVQPGAYLDRLNAAAADAGLMFAPDPATHSHCAIGGMIGNNSCGVHSVIAGRTSDNVHELDVLLYDGTRMTVGATGEDGVERIIAEGGRRGEIYSRLRDLRDRYGDLIRESYPRIPRRVSGYNLDELLPENGFNVARALAGTEGTCALTLEATVDLVPDPPERVLLVLGFPDIYSAADVVPEVMPHNPIALEGIDDFLVDDMRKKQMHLDAMKHLPEGAGWLLVEFGADDRAEARAAAEDMLGSVFGGEGPPSHAIFEDPELQHQIWTLRESALGATAFVPGEEPTWEGWEDSAVPPEAMGDYLRDLRRLYEDHGYRGSFYGHFGQGCLHTRINFDFRTAQGIAKYRAFIDEAADLVLKHGGSLSGEHGDGQARGELLTKMFGPELVDAFREFKSVWDPDGMMNPGKVVDPYRMDENLRLGTGFDPWMPETHFSFSAEGGSFVDAGMRCVGVGLCRKEEGGTMCPSYMATREERHSTRGRARLLFEMLQGDPVADGWRDESVDEALELCLACKACKSECPVNVDMATYKAEFYSHHYKGRLRPRAAYALGLIYWWSRLASKVPRLANFVTHARGLSRLVKRAGGVAPERDAPLFAQQTFRQWFASHRPPPDAARRVVLWPDTFNDNFHPEVAKAAVRVLEAAGCRVEIPPRPLCCGRPLYDYGMLDLAKRMLRRVLVTMKSQIEEGVAFVGLEPSCVSVFRDELTNLFPRDQNARRLRDRFMTLAGFLQEIGWEPRPLDRRMVVHGHCHHEAVLGMDPDLDLLRRLGEVEVLDAGCCGLAGSFGFEAGDKYEVSIKAGERVLLPAVRDAHPDALIVTDGFSCKHQIEELSDRQALHLAQVLDLTLPKT